MKFWIFLCFLVLNLIAFGQLNIESPFDKVQFNRDSIETHKIRSVLVFAEIGMNGDFQNGIISGKAREYEFDSFGRVIYEISSYDDGYYPLAEFGRGSEIVHSEYNDQNLKTSFCQESFKRISKLYSEFDSDGNLVLLERIIEGKNVSGHDKRSFEWKDGEMVNSIQILPKENSEATKFDIEGRPIEFKTKHSKTTYQYSLDGDTLTTNYQTYMNDTLASSGVVSTLKERKDLFVCFLSANSSGELELEVRVEYDQFGNAIQYFREDHSMKEHFEGVYEREPERIEIVNIYDDRGLLLKQEFYLYSQSIERQLIKVYRYVYEKTPLRLKFEKGELRAKEIEMHESYGPDY